MFEIPSSTLQFVSTAYPNDRFRGGNFGVSFLYIELFLIDSLWVAIKMEKGVFLIFPVKDIQLAALLQNFKGPKNIHQFSIPSISSGKAKLSMASCRL